MSQLVDPLKDKLLGAVLRLWSSPTVEERQCAESAIFDVWNEISRERERTRALCEAAKPFVDLVKGAQGPYKVERLALYQWHRLKKAFCEVVK